jgi:hypothetical protein
LAIACAGSAIAVAAWPVGAGADAPEASGYWTKLQVSGSPVTVPASPTVPAGGLMVANDPSGPTAISAVRFTVPDGSAGALVLHVAAGSTAAVANISACPTTRHWDPPGGAGAIKDAPTFDATRCVIGQLAADSSTFTFQVSAAAAGGAAPGSIDVALVPTAAAGPAPFSVTFSAPGPDALTPTSASPAAGGTEPTSDASPSTSPSPGYAGGFTSVDPSSSSFRGSVVATPGTPAPPTVAAPAAASRPQVAQRPAGATSAVAALPGHRDARGQRALAVGLLVLMTVGWWWFGSRPVRPPQLLGSLGGRVAPADPGGGAAVVVRGIGRFARPREAPLNRR